MVTWREESENPGGVKVLVDGVVVATVPGLPAASLPGEQSHTLTGASLGRRVISVEGAGGASVAVTQTVLASQPFHDVIELKCTETQQNGSCEIEVDWNNPGPLPSFYEVRMDGGLLFTVDFFEHKAEITNTIAGLRCVSLVGIMVNTPSGDEGRYAGSEVSSCCAITCPCAAPSGLVACQVAYGPGPEDNAVLARWTNGEASYAGGIHGIVDGVVAGTLPGDTRSAQFEGVSPGRHVFEVQGDCGDAGKSASLAATLDILARTPHQHPVVGELACEWSAEGGGTTTVRWTNGDASESIDVYVDGASGLSFLGSIPPDSTSVRVTGTKITDRIALQFFRRVGGTCYGSDVLECDPAPGRSFVRGICNGAGASPDISSAVFGLNYLFSAGSAPPCLEACDSNGDGGVDISDFVYVLAYLFLGGPAPSGWVDSDGDKVPDPTCERSAPAADCETASPACP